MQCCDKVFLKKECVWKVPMKQFPGYSCLFSAIMKVVVESQSRHGAGSMTAPGNRDRMAIRMKMTLTGDCSS